MRIVHIDSNKFPHLQCGRKYRTGKTTSLITPTQAQDKELIRQLGGRLCKQCLNKIGRRYD